MKLILRTACITILIVSTKDACTREENVKLPVLCAQSSPTAVYGRAGFSTKQHTAPFCCTALEPFMVLSVRPSVRPSVYTGYCNIHNQPLCTNSCDTYGTNMQWPASSSRGGSEENQEVSNTRSASPFCTPSRRPHSSCRMWSADLRVKRRQSSTVGLEKITE